MVARHARRASVVSAGKRQGRHPARRSELAPRRYPSLAAQWQRDESPRPAARIRAGARHAGGPGPQHPGCARTGCLPSEDGRLRVDEFLRTSGPHFFAAGDVIGTEQDAQMATPVGSHDGGIAAHNVLASDEPPRVVNHRVVPRAIFMDPPVAVVGMTEQEAVAAGYPCWCRTRPMSLVPRAGAIRDTRGIVKMVADAKTNELLGVTMIGNGAAEVIHEAAMALRFRAGLHDFIDLLHVYPTMAEALKIGAISRFKDPAKLSCCAE